MTWDLRLGDCLDPLVGMASLPDKSVDHVITDPPYDEHTHHCGRRGVMRAEAKTGRRCEIARNRDLGFEPLTDEQMARAADEIARVVRRWVLVFCTAEMVDRWKRALESATSASECIGIEHIRVGAWIKLAATPQFTGDRPAQGFEAIEIAHRAGRKRWNGGGKHGVWSCPIVQNCNGNSPRLHTTQKPLELMERLILDFTDPGDLILDPFAGSGTTGVAALRHGRRFVGWEMQENYHATASKRLAETREQLALGFGAGEQRLGAVR